MSLTDLLYEANGLSVSHDAPNACLLVKWQGTHDGPAKRACCLTVLDLVKQTGATKGLVDGTQDLDGWNEAVEWLGHIHQQALIAQGVWVIAWVLPTNLVARQHVEKVVDLYIHPAVQPPPRMLYNTFSDVEAAYSWLIYRAVPAEVPYELAH